MSRYPMSSPANSSKHSPLSDSQTSVSRAPGGPGASSVFGSAVPGPIAQRAAFGRPGWACTRVQACADIGTSSALAQGAFLSSRELWVASMLRVCRSFGP